MNYRFKQYFNLIEVTLAIGILAIGATAVLALFPLGMDRNRDSIGENYCADAAGDFSAFIKTMALADWDAAVNALPDSKPNIGNDAAVTNFDNWDKIVNYSVSDDIYEIGDPPEVDGVYGLKKATNGVLDFSGKAVVWRSPIGSLSEEMAMAVHIEINWPVNMKYFLRKKNYYYFELYNYDYED